MPYKKATYAELLRWCEDTEIEYVPNGKQANTMSYDRYLKYSQAKTVAQAIDLGSKPQDLLNDYEKKILKRVGGPYREKPICMAEVRDNSKATKTDHMFARWSRNLDDEGDAGAAPAGIRRSKDEGAAADPAKAALAKLKSFQVAKKDLMSTKLMAMRAGGTTSTAVGGSIFAGAAARPSPTRPAHSQGDSEVKSKPVATLASKGLLAKVLAKRNQPSGGAVANASAAQAKEQPVAGSTSKAGKPKKLLGFSGGLLARVQNRAQGQVQDPEAASTPQPKRARTDAVSDESSVGADALATSGKKTGNPFAAKLNFSTQAAAQAPTSPAKVTAMAEVTDVAMATDVEKVTLPAPVAAPAPPPDPTCHLFLRMAKVLVVEGEQVEASAAVEQHLRAVAQSAATPHTALRAALRFLDPSVVVPEKVVAAALATAYAWPEAPCLEGEALAAKAREDHAHLPPRSEDAVPLTTEDVADALQASQAETEEEVAVAASRCARLLSRAQDSMEAFYLVRVMQGQMAPSKDVFQSALVSALAR